uniref:Uncharacterized protein n=1 Tax=Stomoxys calcitrans TaxID=35570 RepID=A0A1I8Q8Z2_STOCA
MHFYHTPLSAPCRAVTMTAKALGLQLNEIFVDLQSGAQFQPDFLKINPQHCVPSLVDGDLRLWESRAIMIYLVEQYGRKDDPLYPSCPKKRGLINQRLYFDADSLYKNFAEYFYSQIFYKKPANAELYQKLQSSLEFLNIFLSHSEYVAGDNLTLADLSILATVTTIDMGQIDLVKYANINRWYQSIRHTAPGAAENWAGVLGYKKFIDNTTNYNVFNN